MEPVEQTRTPRVQRKMQPTEAGAAQGRSRKEQPEQQRVIKRRVSKRGAGAVTITDLRLDQSLLHEPKAPRSFFDKLPVTKEPSLNQLLADQLDQISRLIRKIEAAASSLG
jgi:hypothetical protein